MGLSVWWHLFFDEVELLDENLRKKQRHFSDKIYWTYWETLEFYFVILRVQPYYTLPLIPQHQPCSKHLA